MNVKVLVGLVVDMEVKRREVFCCACCQQNGVGRENLKLIALVLVLLLSQLGHSNSVLTSFRVM